MESPQPCRSRYEHIRCNLCGADETETVYEAQHIEEAARDLVDTYRASGDELLVDRLARCRACGLHYLSPRPTSTEILEAYSAGDDHAYVSQMAARERTFADAVVQIEKLLPGRGRILDVGTAAGAFLCAAQRREWQVEGCEPNQWLARWGSRRYGIPIRTGELFDHSFPPQSFDVVTLWDVIEHTPDPARVIRTANELIKPGGLLIINYPDIGSWLARALGRRWPFLSSVHLYYFTRETMKSLLERHGFEVIMMRPHVQRLELDYLLSRGAMVSAALSKSVRAVARLLGLGRRHVPYWMGQTFVAARRGGVAQTLAGGGRPLVGLCGLWWGSERLSEAVVNLASLAVCV
jgi:SAM-dependent methyltransferase